MFYSTFAVNFYDRKRIEENLAKKKRSRKSRKKKSTKHIERDENVKKFGYKRRKTIKSLDIIINTIPCM